MSSTGSLTQTVWNRGQEYDTKQMQDAQVFANHSDSDPIFNPVNMNMQRQMDLGRDESQSESGEQEGGFENLDEFVVPTGKRKRGRKKGSKYQQSEQLSAEVSSSNICKICNKSFTAYSSLQRHEITHTENSKPFSCDICNARFTQKPSLVTHTKRKHEGVLNFPCFFCEKKFVRNVELQDHIQSKHKEKTHISPDLHLNYKCSNCGRGYLNMGMLKTHEKTHLPGSLAKPKRDVPELMRTCQICSKIFNRVCHLRRHEKEVHGNQKKIIKRPFQCPHCPKAFKDKVFLRVHVVSRHKFKERTVDPNIISNEASLNRLGKIFAFVCQFCPKKFRSEKSHKMHETSHTAVKCPHCSKKSKSKDELEIHIQRRHKKKKLISKRYGNASFACKLCSEICKSQILLKLHTREKHPDPCICLHKICLLATETDNNKDKDKYSGIFLVQLAHNEQSKCDSEIQWHLCMNCGRAYSSFQRARIHVKSCDGDDKYNICLERTRHPMDLVEVKIEHSIPINENAAADEDSEIMNALLMGHHGDDRIESDDVDDSPSPIPLSTENFYLEADNDDDDDFDFMDSLSQQTLVKNFNAISTSQASTSALNTPRHVTANDNAIELDNSGDDLPGDVFLDEPVIGGTRSITENQPTHKSVNGVNSETTTSVANRIEVDNIAFTSVEPFQCKTCLKMYSSKLSLKYHVNTKHSDVPLPTFVCDICRRSFTVKRQMQIHRRGHTGEKPFKCTLCEFTTADPGSFCAHKKRVHESVNGVNYENAIPVTNKIRVDSINELTNQSAADLVRRSTHQRASENKEKQVDAATGTVICVTNQLDSDSDESEATIPSFLNIVSAPSLADFPHPPEALLREVEVESQSASTNVSNSCTSFASGTTSNVDIDILPKGFPTIFAATTEWQKKYMNVVFTSPDKPYQCKVCLTMFASKYSLKGHIDRTHSEGPPPSFLCDLCGRSFPYKQQMQIHRRVHTGEKPFKCDKCDFVTSSQGGLYFHNKSKHIKDQHPKECKKRETCTICEKTFSYGALRIHMHVQHAAEKPEAFTCNICFLKFTIKSNAISHVRNVHKEEVKEAQTDSTEKIDFNTFVHVDKTLLPKPKSVDKRLCGRGRPPKFTIPEVTEEQETNLIFENLI